MRDISEILPLCTFNSNPDPSWDTNNYSCSMRDRGQYLAGSLSGADASKKVTEAFTKVGYPGMEIREIV